MNNIHYLRNAIDACADKIVTYIEETNDKKWPNAVKKADVKGIISSSLEDAIDVVIDDIKEDPTAYD